MPIGDGVPELLKGLKSLSPLLCPPLLIDQNAVSVAKCAYRAHLAGKSVSAGELQPFYLRLPQAERERLERLEKEKPQKEN